MVKIIELYVDYKIRRNTKNSKFAITDLTGQILYYGRFFDSEIQFPYERSTIKKVLILTDHIKKVLKLDNLKIILHVSPSWRSDIELDLAHNIEILTTPGLNLAHKYVNMSGFKHYEDHYYDYLTKIIQI